MNVPLPSGSMQGFHIFLIKEVMAQHIHKPVDEFPQPNRP